MKNRNAHRHLADLGSVVRKTRGGAKGFVDIERTLQPSTGLSVD